MYVHTVQHTHIICYAAPWLFGRVVCVVLVTFCFTCVCIFISYYKFSLMTDSTCIPNKIICTVACHTCRKYLNTLIYLMCPLKFASCQLVKLRSSIIVFKNKMFISPSVFLKNENDVFIFI